jgi:predicted metal-binding membrane protein
MATEAERPDHSAAEGRDRLLVGAGLAVLAILAWALTAHQAHVMQHMDHGRMRGPDWSLIDGGLLIAMWSVMMIAMMTPAVAPIVVAFAAINRRRRERGAPHVATSVFVAGYLLAWIGFSVLATIVQLGLHRVGSHNPIMAQTSTAVAAVLCLAAGLYQFSPLKEVCLMRCRSTNGFILSEWRDGAFGALIMGLRHGLYCVGCCSPLMLLLSPVRSWIRVGLRGLTMAVMVEKLLPRPDLWRRIIGSLLPAGLAV